MTVPIQEGSGNVPQQAFVRWNDPQGNRLAAVNRDGTLYSQGIVTNPSSGTPGSLQTASATHSLTAAEIVQGWCLTPIVWHTPFPDLNYLIFSGITSLLLDSADIAVGASHDITVGGCTVLTILTAAIPIVQGQNDTFATDIPFSYSFTPAESNLYQISVYISADPPTSSGFAGDAVQGTITWRDFTTTNTSVLTPAGLITTRNGQPASFLSPIYASATYPIVVSVAFTTYSLAGAVSATSSFVSGAFSGTAMPYGATMTQATSGATAEFYGSFNNGGLAMVYQVLTGIDGGQEWSAGTAHFTPSSSPTPTVGLFGGGGGVLQQAVTGATGSELDLLVGIGIEHLGPGLTGGTPDATHAWIDLVSGGVLLPSAAPVLDTFGYDISVRITETPNNSIIYTPGNEFIVNALGIHS